jgi:hypothetical protein
MSAETSSLLGSAPGNGIHGSVAMRIYGGGERCKQVHKHQPRSDTANCSHLDAQARIFVVRCESLQRAEPSTSALRVSLALCTDQTCLHGRQERRQHCTVHRVCTSSIHSLKCEQAAPSCRSMLLIGECERACGHCCTGPCVSVRCSDALQACTRPSHCSTAQCRNVSVSNFVGFRD